MESAANRVPPSKCQDTMPVECVKELGTGSYGKVYLVHLKSTRKFYAMKILNLTPLTKTQKDMIQKEIDIMSVLKHGNVIRFKQAFLSRETEIHIIMEYANLGDLSQMLKKKRLSNVQQHDWFYQILCGLEYIHEHKIIHRDVKPSNIFLKSSCNCTPGCDKTAVKIGDFGVSTVLKLDSQYKTATSIGTPYYLSPEVCKGIAYDFKSDMWSLGCVLYEMTCSQLPFLASNVEALIKKILCGLYPSPPHNADPLLTSLLPKLINIKPEQRPSSAFLKQLFGLQMMREAVHSYVKSEQVVADKGVTYRVNDVPPKIKRRCYSAIEKEQITPKNKLPVLKDIHNDSGYKSPKSPLEEEAARNDNLATIRMRIDRLLTKLERCLGGALIGECIDTYRQTNSVSQLKRVLGAHNVAYVSSILQLVYLEDRCSNFSQN